MKTKFTSVNLNKASETFTDFFKSVDLSSVIDAKSFFYVESVLLITPPPVRFFS